MTENASNQSVLAERGGDEMEDAHGVEGQVFAKQSLISPPEHGSSIHLQ